jgi:hypothetical protein
MSKHETITRPDLSDTGKEYGVAVPVASMVCFRARKANRTGPSQLLALRDYSYKIASQSLRPRF